MLYKQLGAAAALAGFGHAFLLPPPTSNAANADIINDLPFELNMAADGRVLEVACPGCLVEVTDLQGGVHRSDAESVLKLNLSIAHNGPDQLLLNGLPIYPIDPRSQTFMTPLTADQMVKNADNTWSYVATPALGYSLSVKHPMQSADEEELDLVAIHIEIMEVANKFLNGIPSVELKLIQTPSGGLVLGDAKITAPQTQVSEPADNAQECTNLICKWRAIIAGKLSKLKGCSKNKGHGRVKGGRPHGHQQGRPHRRPHGTHFRHRHSLGRFIRNVAVHILVPVMIGIAVGITASLVGMLVGNVVIFVWRLFFRRERAQYVAVSKEEIVVVEGEDETSAFLEHQGPPPTYSEADEKTEE